MSEKRKSLSKKIRFDVFKRDGFICQYCGMTPPAVVLEVDHVHPVSDGGTNDIDNLLTACFDCNRGKGAGDLSVSPQTLAEKSEVLAEKQEQLKAFDRLVKSKRSYENRKIKEIENAFKAHFDGYSFSPKFKESVRLFLQKLPFSTVLDAMHLACLRIGRREDSIKYFCGICWKTIREAGGG